MRVYVASKFEDKHRVRELYEYLYDDRHEITHDWTGEDDAGMTGAKLEAYHRHCAAEALDGVLEAEALILLPHERGKGSYVELGAALAIGIPVVVVKHDDVKDCVFLRHADIFAVVDDEKGMLEALRRIQNGEDRVGA